MAHQVVSAAKRRQQLAFLVAWLSGTLIVICLLAYWLLARQIGSGWFNAFLRDFLPGAALAAAAYLVAYFVLFRQGLGRDQQLVEELVEGLVARSPAAPEVLGFSAHPGQIDWDNLLAGASDADIAGRWFSAWTAENYDALRGFFERGGRMRAFMLGPSNDAAIERAAKQHAGYSEPTPVEPSRHKIRSGARRLVDAAAMSRNPEKALEIRFIEHPDVVLSQTLFRLSGERGEKLVLVGLDNFRGDRHRAPAVIVDLRASEQLRQFWARELEGFLQHSKPARAADLADEELA